MSSLDVNEATQQVGQIFHPHELTRVGCERGFHAELVAVTSGPIVSGILHYNSNSDLYCPTIDGYHINIPLSGELVSVSGSTTSRVGTDAAVVYESGSDAKIFCPQGSQLNIFAMKIDGTALRSVLSGLIDGPVSDPIDLGGPLDLTGTDGKAWWSLVREVYRAQVENSILANHLMIKPLSYSMIVGLLMLAENRYSATLVAPEPAITSGVISKAVEYINGHTADSLTPADIAAAVGVSVRSLQRGFREQHQCTPMEFVRKVRLNRVRVALAAASPEAASVAQLATAWGFTHLGRFAADYRREYGETPSETLRATSL
ncbi:AraC family transcriptional regulator [Mycobacterium sp. MS1601]|uniref:AraC family transcriptional regulator n=1 Tax=Mycobacterium sp. MS1601 TaxID=1936029 RepID=UPI00178CE7C0|nr:helix-turn-helix transcriptional regulator [Mycobacterium sp. MS1601]